VHPFVAPLERMLALSVALANIASATLWPAGVGAFAALLILTPLLMGPVTSTSRYAVVAFPAFLALALVSRRERLHRMIAASLLVVQAPSFRGLVPILPGSPEIALRRPFRTRETTWECRGGARIG
jgi:hypothetical protein